MFHYSSYWGTWSRVLGWTKDGSVIELNVTGLNGLLDLDEKIRIHCTALGGKDILCDNLPDNVYQRLSDQNVGPAAELLKKILSHDYLAELAGEVMKKANANSNGGGVPFAWIKENLGTKYWRNQ